MNPKLNILDDLHKQLVVSCQPVTGGPLDRTDFVVGMAEAAIDGGAKGVRLEGIDSVAAAAERLTVPIIGIVKRALAEHPVRITPLEADVERLAAAGATIIAVDATDRSRPVPLKTLIEAIHGCGCFAMADCSTFEEGLAAAELGCEIVASTMSGYTGGPEPETPDYDLVERLAARGLRVMAEGRIRTPEQATTALARGAWSVTVGSAITRVEYVTGWFVEALAGSG